MTLRLAHLSDIHFGGENAAATAGALQVLQAGAFDLVVLSGDLTRFGEVEELRSAAAWLAQIPQPKLVTPGNHDAPYLAWAERVVAPFRRYEQLSGLPRSRPTSPTAWRSVASTPRAGPSRG